MQFKAETLQLPEIFALQAKWNPRGTALIFEEQRISWQELIGSANRLANALLDRAPGKTRVVMVMDNCPQAIQSLLGVMTAGYASVPMNVTVSDEALVGMINDSGASMILVSECYRERVDRLLDQLPGIDIKVSTGPGEGDWTGWNDFLEGHGENKPSVQYIPGDIIAVIYSSGTTGTPKGIVHSFERRRNWARDVCMNFKYKGDVRYVINIGFYSNIAQAGILAAYLRGGCVVLCQGFDPGEFLELAEREKITHAGMVPIQYQYILQTLKARQAENKLVDISSLDCLISVGSSLGAELKQELFEIFACGVGEVYGLTEGGLTILQPEDSAGRFSSVGKPFTGYDLLILDEDNREAKANEPGEIVFLAPTVMLGYLNRPEATAECTWTDAKGRQWLRTGDIGRLDEDGYLYIVDRKKDMILSGGQNIFPQDIEQEIIKHPSIADVAVVAGKHKAWGETPVAIVVPEEDVELSTGEIMEWCNERVGKRQRISDVFFATALPRNPNGKVLKRQLREEFCTREYS